MSEARPIKVAFILPSFSGGGAQRVMMTIAAKLDRRRFQPSVIAFDATGPWRDLLPADVPVTDLRRDRFRRAIAPLRRVLGDTKPDIVFCTMGYMNLGVLALRPFLPSMRFVVREANTPHRNAKGHLQGRLYKMAYRWLYNRADRVIAPTAEIAGELNRDFGVESRVLQVVHNPVDESSLRAAAIPVKRAGGAGRRFVAAGRLSPQKAFDRLIAFMADMPPDTKLSIFGDGEERSRLEAQRAALSLNDRVLLPEFEPRLAPWLAGADALLLSSRWEGLPNIVLEALACGTPVIATDEAGGIDELAILAPEGAITVAAAGQPFRDAMVAVPPRTEINLRASLLPQSLRAEHVVQEYENMFVDVLSR